MTGSTQDGLPRGLCGVLCGNTAGREGGREGGRESERMIVWRHNKLEYVIVLEKTDHSAQIQYGPKALQRSQSI